MTSGPWKVGELAKATGLTVRTLHHYDELDLLRPSSQTASGHRLYISADLGRLQRILSLRQLGFSLEQIAACLDQPDFAPLPVVRKHMAKIREQLQAQRHLLEQLQQLERTLAAAGEASSEQLLDIVEGLAMIEKYYTKDQLEELAARQTALGEARIKEVEAEWPRLMAEVRTQMSAGTDPGDPAVQALAARWAALLAEFTGGNPGIERSLKTMYQSEPAAPTKFGMPPDMMELAEYIRNAQVRG